VLVEQVFAEVAGKVAPDRVNVVSVVRRVIQFGEERRSLNAVVVRVAPVDTARPGKIDIKADMVDLRESAFGELIGHIARVFFHEGHERIELLGAHLGSGKTGWLALERGLAASLGKSD